MMKKTDKIFVKCSESVMLSDPPCKDGNSWFVRVPPWNLNLAKKVEAFCSITKC